MEILKLLIVSSWFKHANMQGKSMKIPFFYLFIIDLMLFMENI